MLFSIWSILGPSTSIIFRKKRDRSRQTPSILSGRTSRSTKPYYLASSNIDTLALMNESKGTNWLHWRKKRSRSVLQAKHRVQLSSYPGSHAGGFLLPSFSEEKLRTREGPIRTAAFLPFQIKIPFPDSPPVSQVLASKIKQFKALEMTNQEIAQRMKIGRKTLKKEQSHHWALMDEPEFERNRLPLVLPL